MAESTPALKKNTIAIYIFIKNKIKKYKCELYIFTCYGYGAALILRASAQPVVRGPPWVHGSSSNYLQQSPGCQCRRRMSAVKRQLLQGAAATLRSLLGVESYHEKIYNCKLCIY